MDTSRTRTIKLLLLQAWRERWSDVTWGIKIKSVLPHGVSGDVYDLAECILQQALVGPGPNTLFMSYLMHCLCCRVVSYGAVLTSISRYQRFDRPYCILCLLDFLKSFQTNIGCHGNEEQCIVLCKSVVSATHWLYSCVLHSITELAELKQVPESETPMEKSTITEIEKSIMEKSYDTLLYFSNSTFIKSLLYVGKFEDTDMYTQMLEKHKELETKLMRSPSPSNIPKETIEVVMSLVSSVDSLPCVHVEKGKFENKRLQILSSTINIMVGLDAVLHPTSDLEVFVKQLLLVKKHQNYTLPQLYCEIIRASLMGLGDGMGSAEELKWCSFTFLKLPKVITRIHETQAEDVERDDALEKGFDLLLQFVPMLDHADAKGSCDCIQSLTSELFKANLLTEDQMKKIVDRRQKESLNDCPRPDQYGNQVGASAIIRAEQTVASIFNSLDPDYSKLQGKLLELLCHMVPGKNFEIILSAAVATGHLNTFLNKLVQFNECHKDKNTDTSKATQTCPLLFDISFLMLCHITQQYGLSAVTSNPTIKDSFFVTWACECLAEGGKYKDPSFVVSRCDQMNVDLILDQFIHLKQYIKGDSVQWDEFCVNVPSAIREILIAWEHGALATEKIKEILDHIKSRMCCLPVCISAWLCNYINMLHHEERLKPINMLQQFITPIQIESEETAAEGEGTSSEGSSQAPKMPGSDQYNLFYKERSALMVIIIKKMMNDLHPPRQTTSKVPPSVAHGLTTNEPLGKVFNELYRTAHLRGWLDLKSIHYFDSLLCSGGARWLTNMIVRFTVGFQHARCINRSVDMALGIFHLDMEQFAISLLVHVLPFYLYNDIQQEHLAEPHGTALARLTVITIYAALQSRRCDLNAGIKVGCKRSYRDVVIDDASGYADNKMHPSYAELLEDTSFRLESSRDDHLVKAISNPINRAIADLMRTFFVIASDATISARSMFSIRFLEQVVLCAKDEAQTILQFMPLGLVPLLLKAFPDEITHEFILIVNSMLSSRSRKISALSLCQLTIAQNRLNYSDYILLGSPTS